MSKLALCALTLLMAAQSATPVPPSPSSEAASFTYRFENDRFQVTQIDLTIGAGDEGRLVFSRKGLARPVERSVRIAPAVRRQLDDLVARLDFFASGEDYQTPEDHSNLGKVTIAASRASAAREVVFNFTTNRDMAALASTLRGIANREMFAFDLETAIRFQPLETPRLIKALGDEIQLGRITDPGALAPLLQAIADDVSLPLIARNRAGALAGRIEAARQP
jgi:hypothetical protein